jgi:TRAP transporter TAXI family solute receptor
MLGFNRWHLFEVLAVILCIAGISWLALGYFIPAPPSRIAIAGSFKGSHYNFVTAQYKEILARSHVMVDPRLTEGAVDNLRLLKDPASGIQVALMQGGVSDGKQSPGLKSLGRINYQIFWVFCRATDTFDDLRQLKGKRIAVGPAGSATKMVAEKILAAAGITSETATLLPLGAESAVEALNDSKVDVIFIAFAPEAPIILSLLKNPNFRLINFEAAEALTRIFPFLVRLVMPQGLIDYERKFPPADVTVIATTNAVLVRDDIHPAIIDLLTQTMLEAHGGPGLFHKAGDFPTQTDPEYPVAQSARDFYKNGPSFLHRYLPFWITNYAQRAIAVLATVIAIIVPLFSYAPKLYRGLVENRLRSMYRQLRAIEATLQRNVSISELSAIEADLESVDRAIHILGVPMRHSDLFFSLKAYIDLVRTRLGSRRAELQGQIAKAAKAA